MPASIWATQQPSQRGPTAPSNDILKEDGFYILTEAGDKIAKES